MSKQHKLGLSGPIELLATHHDPGSPNGWIDIGLRVYATDLGHVQELLERAMTHGQEIRLVRKEFDDRPPVFVMWVTEEGHNEPD